MAQANIKAVITAEDRASAVLKGFGDKAQTLGTATANAFKRLAVAASAASAAITAAGVATLKWSLSQFRDIQKNVAGIQALTKNTKEAKAVLKDAIDFVQGKPFDRLDTIRASKQLLAFGRSSKKVKDDLRILGNTVILTGGEWENLTRVYGRVFAQNRLMNDDFQILTDAGVGLGRVLMKNLGVSMSDLRDKMAEGEVSFADFKKAMQEAAPDKAVENALNTFDNRMLSLKASIRDVGFTILGVDFSHIEEGGRPLVKPGGLLDRLQNGIEGLTRLLRSTQFKEGFETFREGIVRVFWAIKDFVPQLQHWGRNILDVAEKIANYLSPKLEALWNTIETKVIPVLAKLWKEVIQPLLPVIGTALVLAIGLALDAFNFLLAAVTPVINFMLDNKWVVLGFAAAFGTLYASMLFNKAFNALTIGFHTFKLVTIPSTIASLKALRLAFIAAFPGALVIAAIAGVIAMVNKLLNKFDAINSKIADNTLKGLNSTDAAIAKAKKQYEAGKISKKHYNAILNNSYSTGGYTGQGSTNEVAGIVHKGEYVVPKNQVNQSTGMPKAGATTINVNVNVGMYAGSEMEKRKMATELMKAFKDVSGNNINWGTP